MKTLLISLFLIGSLMTNKISQETETMTAAFDYYEDNIYYFVDADGYSNGFNYLSADVQKNYDLTSDAFIGKNFKISYTSETEMDESDEELTVTTIVALKLLD